MLIEFRSLDRRCDDVRLAIHSVVHDGGRVLGEPTPGGTTVQTVGQQSEGARRTAALARIVQMAGTESDGTAVATVGGRSACGHIGEGIAGDAQ